MSRAFCQVDSLCSFFSPSPHLFSESDGIDSTRLTHYGMNKISFELCQTKRIAGGWMDFFSPFIFFFRFFLGRPPLAPPPLTPFFTFAIRLVHLRKREKRSLTQLHLDIVCDSICLSISQTQSNQSVICQRLFFFLSSGGPETYSSAFPIALAVGRSFPAKVKIRKEEEEEGTGCEKRNIKRERK